MSRAPSRRGLLAGIAALGATGAALAPVTAALGAAMHTEGAEAPESDAELIAACDAYMRATDAYNRPDRPCYRDCNDDPLWHAMNAAEDHALDLAPTTMAGFVAKATVVLFLARQPDGHYEFGESFTGYWPEQVVCDLLAHAGIEVPE